MEVLGPGALAERTMADVDTGVRAVDSQLRLLNDPNQRLRVRSGTRNGA